MNEQEMQYAIANKRCLQGQICIPNVSLYGPEGMYEADLLIITRTKHVMEIEIKVSLEDMKRDLKKKIIHNHKMIYMVYYAFPKKLYDEYKEQINELVPSFAGIMIIKEDNFENIIIRRSLKRKVRPISFTKQIELMKLAAMKWCTGHRWTCRQKEKGVNNCKLVNINTIGRL